MGGKGLDYGGIVVGHVVAAVVGDRVRVGAGQLDGVLVARPAIDNHDDLDGDRPVRSAFADPKRLALGGFLAGYSGLTRDAYELDLRQYVSWCDDHDLDLFQARRADMEEFARELERRGRARATLARRLCTVSSFYRYVEEEGLLDHSPAVHVRRPRID